MNRRTFIKRGSLIGGGLAVLPSMAYSAAVKSAENTSIDWYAQFQKPDLKYHPYVRWWWNGGKVQKDEIIRELRLLKDAGIGGVEINPVKFPEFTDDLGIKSLEWLSDEWIEMLQVAFDEAKKLGLTCDLIVGSGWPFGGEFLKGDERGQAIVIDVNKVTGPTVYEISKFALLSNADPSIGHPYSGRTQELLSLKLVPDPLNNINDVVDITSKIPNDWNQLVGIDIPEGNYAIYSLVRVNSFGTVIMGAPGADGPTLNHLDKHAVQKYLDNMSDTIQKKTGPLSKHIRSFFTDSMELEGANWTSDMPEAFKKRNGYDIMPYLPLTLLKFGSFGNATSYEFEVGLSPDMKEMLQRMRYDFEVTKAEMFLERFNKTYQDWCRGLGVKSRAQAYGRGFYPLETSMGYDIPEGESWTTNWLQHRLGEEMSNEDYRRGRGYTMIDKFVSSAAHLTGKRWVSAEEMTNTYRVFNATLEFLKLGSDQTLISGITHSIFHGFNYSPANAPFPGWIRYGAYYNEKNNWWPYFKYFNTYKGRMTSILQQGDMYADIAIMPPTADMWTTMGMQQEPFPSDLNVPYTSILWEAMCKNGNGTDYISDSIINNSQVKNGKLIYGPRSYGAIFLPEVERMNPETVEKLHDFVATGGKLFCIEKQPHMSLGWLNYKERDKKVLEIMDKIKKYSDRFICLPKPEDKDFITWYTPIQEKYGLKPFVKIEKPDPYFMVNRYVKDNKDEFMFFVNCHLHDSYTSRIVFPKEVTQGKQAWMLDINKGERYTIELDKEGGFELYLGHASSCIIMFDKTKGGTKWNPIPVRGFNARTLKDWDVELQHSIEKNIETTTMETPTDLKDTKYVDFTGTVVYKKKVTITDPKNVCINLGKVFGISELYVNGKDCGVTWYGDRLYNISQYLTTGDNTIEIRVITTMGNYVKTLKDNKVAQKWTNRPGRPQPIQSMGLAGPVTIYQI